MTVAAVILPADAAEALADAAGRIAIRRIVDAAWAGGALPIVVVCSDADGAVAEALAGSPARLADPAGATGAVAAQVGVRAAMDAVRETGAVMLWPGRMAWTDPETVTSLIEAHGRRPDRGIRPHRAGEMGWPILLPASTALAVLDVPDGSLSSALGGMEPASLELGDPGTVLGLEVPLHALPAYAGPPEPVGGPPPEWGAAAAETPEPEVVPHPRDSSPPRTGP